MSWPYPFIEAFYSHPQGILQDLAYLFPLGNGLGAIVIPTAAYCHRIPQRLISTAVYFHSILKHLAPVARPGGWGGGLGGRSS